MRELSTMGGTRATMEASEGCHLDPGAQRLCSCETHRERQSPRQRQRMDPRERKPEIP